MFVGCETSGEGGRHPAIIPDMIHLGGKWRQQISGCDTSGWNMAAAGWNSYLGGMSYDSRPGGMTGSHTPCILDLLMDSKELSSISYCFGDQKAIKTPKLNTI